MDQLWAVKEEQEGKHQQVRGKPTDKARSLRTWPRSRLWENSSTTQKWLKGAREGLEPLGVPSEVKWRTDVAAELVSILVLFNMQTGNTCGFWVWKEDEFKDFMVKWQKCDLPDLRSGFRGTLLGFTGIVCLQASCCCCGPTLWYRSYSVGKKENQLFVFDIVLFSLPTRFLRELRAAGGRRSHQVRVCFQSPPRRPPTPGPTEVTRAFISNWKWNTNPQQINKSSTKRLPTTDKE